MRIYEDQDLPSQAIPPFEYETVGTLVKEIREFRRHRAIEGLVLSHAVELTCMLALKKNEVLRLTIGDVYEPGQGVKDQVQGFERQVTGRSLPLNIPELVKPLIIAYIDAKFEQNIANTALPLFPTKTGRFYDEKTLGRHLTKFVGRYGGAMTWDKIRRMGICCVYDMCLINRRSRTQAMEQASIFGRISPKETFDLLRNRIHRPKPRWDTSLLQLDSEETSAASPWFDEQNGDDDEDFFDLPLLKTGYVGPDIMVPDVDYEENFNKREPENMDFEPEPENYADEGDSEYFFGDDD